MVSNVGPQNLETSKSFLKSFSCRERGQRISLIESVRGMTVRELQKRKQQLIAEIQGVSEALGQLLQERHCLRDQVEGRHVTIAQLLRVQEARAAQLGLQPPVQMSVDAGRR